MQEAVFILDLKSLGIQSNFLRGSFIRKPLIAASEGCSYSRCDDSQFSHFTDEIFYYLPILDTFLWSPTLLDCVQFSHYSKGH